MAVPSDVEKNRQAILNRPKNTYCCSLAKFDTGKNFVILIPYVPSVITYIYQPISRFLPRTAVYHFSCDPRHRILITDQHPESIGFAIV